MATVGPFAFATAATSADSIVAWVNADNAKDNNDVYATATLAANTPPSQTGSYSLKVTNANGGSIVPVGSTIIDWTFTVHRKANRAAAATVIDYVVKTLVTAGATGNNKALTNPSTNLWPTTESSQAYTFTNGVDATITATDMNSANFGMVIQVLLQNTEASAVIASIDYIELTNVTYTAGASPSNPRSLGGGVAYQGCMSY